MSVEIENNDHIKPTEFAYRYLLDLVGETIIINSTSVRVDKWQVGEFSFWPQVIIGQGHHQETDYLISEDGLSGAGTSNTAPQIKGVNLYEIYNESGAVIEPRIEVEEKFPDPTPLEEVFDQARERNWEVGMVTPHKNDLEEAAGAVAHFVFMAINYPELATKLLE